MENCFKHIAVPGYSNDSNQTFFSHLHLDQYCSFLYFFMNTLWDYSQNKVICDKTMLLIRCLNGMMLSYKCNLPDIFYFNHPVGSVIGNAQYEDFLVVFQNVTINTGTLHIGKGCALCAGAKIIGNESIGERVTVGVDAVVYKQKIEDDKLIIRDYEGKILVKDNSRPLVWEIFKDKI